jgi:ATP-dependent DNA helicase RecG
VSESNLDLLPAHTPVTDLAETLVAMANSRGGTLHLELGDATIEDAIDLVREASLQADPTLILPEPRLRDQIIEIIVPPHLPHVFSLNGRYLARDGRNNRSLVGRELRRLLIERGDVSYEEELASGATLDDLDWSQVEAYARRLQGSRAESPRDVLRRRGCVVVRDGEWLPTNAGILLFGREPERFIRGAHITAARFGGTAMGDVFTRQDITGSLPDQIHRAETFLLNSLWRDVHLGTTMSRDEELEYPMEAARELVVNAVSHRDYSIQGDGIRLFIFSDRLEVTSPGGLPGPVTVDNIVDERYSRNSIIVQVLADMGFIERLGYGVDRVIALMQERELPPPEFAETGGGFRVRLFNAGTPDLPPALEIPLAEGLLLNGRQERALQFLTQGDQKRITNGDLQALFPDVHPETIRRDLADLVGKGLLVKLGQKRGSYYVLQK